MSSRRDFLKTLAGGGAAATAGACARVDPGHIIPYLVPPDDSVPGEATWYASVCRECPAGCGVLARVREGRAVKLEGNPGHPVNCGRLCARGQAALQGTYDADRIRQPLAREDGRLQPIDWEQGIQRLVAALAGGRAAWLGHHVTGSLERLIDEWLAAYGEARRVHWEALSYEAVATANEVLFGRRVVPSYELDRADVIVSFGADFLETWLSNVELTRRYAAAHRFSGGAKALHVQVSPRRGLTGENADLWLGVRPGSEALVAAALLAALLARGAGIPPAEERRKIAGVVGGTDVAAAAEAAGIAAGDLESVADVLAGARRGVVLGGGATAASSLATSLEVACALLNYVIGAFGDTVRYDRPRRLAALSSGRELLELVDVMRRGEVGALLVHHANPVHTLPPAAGFVEALEQAGTVVSFASWLDETTALADLVLPDSTPIESWGDHEPIAGVCGLQQPVMRPLHDTLPTAEVLLRVAEAEGRPMAGGWLAYLQARWRDIHRASGGDGGFDDFWNQALRDGGWFDPGPTSATAAAGEAGVARANDETAALESEGVDPVREPDPGDAAGTSPSDQEAARRTPGLRLVDEVPAFDFSRPPLEGAGVPLMTFPTLQWFDGRGANRPWLQELPDPVVKSTWSSWVELHPDTAASLDVATGDVVRLRSSHGELEVAAIVTRSVRPGVAALPLGQGHTEYGRWARGRGVNPVVLLPASIDEASGALLRVAVNVAIEPLGRKERLAITQPQETDHGRGIARHTTLAALTAAAGESTAGRPEVVARQTTLAATPATGESTAGESEAGGEADMPGPDRGGGGPKLYGDHEHPEHRWGMTIDLDACVGCGACEVACAAENNLAIAGRQAVVDGREMSWIRIERYRAGSDTIFLPMLCQHCDHAPCESVCPVYATYHNPEGLNAMVYNRCVGTRYCSNNCPYKVRRFNWKAPDWPQPLNLQLNPDVTPRSKGVMEKCTFCVQRIRGGQQRAAAEGRPLADGDVVPACAQTCPADAIVFGDLLDEESRARRVAEQGSARAYHILEELGTYPAITYLKRVFRQAPA